ncbi:cytochrome c3 family protein [Alienimonas sp. DA493]|uniref:cytochrome c3 family protein n=1 Tax=Alienimonas sp. DA493 TaxID=3373605 RepID=UPI003754CEE8
MAVLPGLAVVGLLGAYVVGLVFYGGSPETLLTGYKPTQPVPFSHALHAGQMKLDCRYCHTGVFKGAHSNVPSTSVCANCHNGTQVDGVTVKVAVHVNSPRLQPVRESIATGSAVPWERVHDLPDYAYFNHSAHVNRGVSCVSCHGRIDRMEVVEQVMPLSMGWCVECHRNPQDALRPPELVTNLAWDWNKEGLESYRTLFASLYDMPVEDADLASPEAVEAFRTRWVDAWQDARDVHPNTDCATCHR